jgi:sugar lactone lactonase YvrE
VDADDFLWTAAWNGAQVARRGPDGALEREVALPVPLVTSCCFGGPALDILFVTTARVGLTPAALQDAPLAGGLFAIRGLGVKGRPMPRFAG